MGRGHAWLRSTRGRTCLESESKAPSSPEHRFAPGKVISPSRSRYELNAPLAGVSFPAFSPLGLSIDRHDLDVLGHREQVERP